MRNVRPTYKGRRRRQKAGCGGCLGKLLILIFVFMVVGFLGYKAFQGLGIRNRILQTRYPIRYQTEVEKYAEEFQLEPALVYAVIRTESGFDPYAVSSAGAKGLMQLKEETAFDCVRALKINHFTVDDLFDPAVNIRLGCYYFSKLLKTYDGCIETAAAAYNGGPGNVEKWLQDEALVDEKGKLTKVPFAETRNYVENIVESYQMYQKLYTNAE